MTMKTAPRIATPSIHSSSEGSFTVVVRIIETIDEKKRIIIVRSLKASHIRYRNDFGGGGSTLFRPNCFLDFSTRD